MSEKAPVPASKTIKSPDLVITPSDVQKLQAKVSNDSGDAHFFDTTPKTTLKKAATSPLETISSIRSLSDDQLHANAAELVKKVEGKKRVSQKDKALLSAYESQIQARSNSIKENIPTDDATQTASATEQSTSDTEAVGTEADAVSPESKGNVTPKDEPENAYEALKETIKDEPAHNPNAEKEAQAKEWETMHGADIAEAMGSQATGEKSPPPLETPKPEDIEGWKDHYGKEFIEAVYPETVQAEKSAPPPPITRENLDAHVKTHNEYLAKETQKSVGEKGLALMRKTYEGYKNLSFTKKMLIGGTLLGVGVGGALVGGPLGTAMLSAAFTGKLAMRGLGAIGAYTLAENISRKLSNKPKSESDRKFDEHAFAGAMGAALALFVMPAIMQSGISEAMSASGLNGSLNSAWLMNHLHHFGTSALAAEASTGVVGADVAGNIAHGTSASVGTLDLAPSLHTEASVGSGLHAAELKVTVPSSEYNLPGGSESPVDFNAEHMPQGIAEASFTHEVTVPKGSNAWTEITKALPKDLSPRSAQNMTGNIESYLRAHPELNPGIKDIANIKPNTHINLPPAEEMAKWHARALGLRTDLPAAQHAPTPMAAPEAQQESLEPLPRPPIPPEVHHSAVMPEESPKNPWNMGSQVANNDVHPNHPNFGAPIQAHTQPGNPFYGPDTRPQEWYGKGSQPNFYDPQQSGSHTQPSGRYGDPNYAPMKAPGVAIPEPTPSEAVESYVHTAFPARGFMSPFTTEPGVQKAWGWVSQMKASEILDPEKIKPLDRLTQRVASKMGRDVTMVLQAAPDIRASNMSVRQILEEGFRRKILNTN